MWAVVWFVGVGCGGASGAGADAVGDGAGSAQDVAVVEDTSAGADTVAADVDPDVIDPEEPRWFRQAMTWDQPVRDRPVDARSAAIIADIVAAGGWGNSDRFQIDFSIEVLDADEATPWASWTPTSDWFATACDLDDVPLPAGGALEGEDGYVCESDGDCHLIVRHGPTRALYEMWRAHLGPAGLEGGCLAVWRLDHAYGETLRGEQCTSADAAGLPIAPLLFTADEVAAGEIRHAVRFILPNSRIRHRTYVRPATHATGAASGGTDAPPYGIRLRLRADYPLSELPSDGARVVARALQDYGMILADGGQIALTAQSDRFTAASWQGLLGSRDLAALSVGDFDVVDLGPTFPWTGDCVRSD